MPRFAARTLPAEADTTAPDGSEVRILPGLAGGSAAHFRLAPGAVSRAGRHRTVEEIWYVLAGSGEMWLSDGVDEAVVALAPGTCLTIPLGAAFQFRAGGDGPLDAFAVTMPPWPAGHRRMGRGRAPLAGRSAGLNPPPLPARYLSRAEAVTQSRTSPKSSAMRRAPAARSSSGSCTPQLTPSAATPALTAMPMS